MDPAKQAAAAAAAEQIEANTIVGLGTGRTSTLFVERLGDRVQSGLQVRGVATSMATADVAGLRGIPLVDIPAGDINVAVDGADEVGPDFTLIKGGGGSHARERVVAAAARRFVVIVDAHKMVNRLSGRVPVSLMNFGLEHTVEVLQRVAGACVLRRDGGGNLVCDDEGNVLGDVQFPSLDDPRAAELVLSNIPGVCAHGIFTDMASQVIVGYDDGNTKTLVP